MSDIYLGFAERHTVFGKNNGPFTLGKPLGWILHVNVSDGNLDGFFAGGADRNPNSVCPNFQVYKVGVPHQHLPLLTSPWCQGDGNYTYAAVETEGYPDEPLNDNQIHYLGLIHDAYRRYAGVPDLIANSPGQRGIGTHQMGGIGWGGHECPGSVRSSQRTDILRASKPTVILKSRKEVSEMLLQDAVSKKGMVIINGRGEWVSGADWSVLVTAGIPHATVSSDLFKRIAANVGVNG